MNRKGYREPELSERQLLDRVEVRLIDPSDEGERARFGDLMKRHHYLKSDRLVGEQLRYVAQSGESGWRC